MNQKLIPAVVGVALAIAITTTMDATGYSMLSALPLFPLLGLFWYLQKFSRPEIGLIWGKPKAYVLALAYPFVVLSLIATIAALSGVVDTSNANWRNVAINMSAGSSIGVIMLLLTEEGFFRGWLWAALQRAELTATQTLAWTTVAFVLWHISAISLDTGFDIPLAEIPVFLVNATLIGTVFGLLRVISGSVLVPSVCHAVWNSIDYPLFGFGEKVGALGITQTHIFGPEVGLLGIGFNLLFVVVLWAWWKRSGLAPQPG